MSDLEKARAEAASLRRKLAAAHGALYFFRKPPENPYQVFDKVEDWQWNPNAVRDIGAVYGNLSELLNETRPEEGDGMALLIELRDLRQKYDAATLELMECQKELDDIESRGMDAKLEGID